MKEHLRSYIQNELLSGQTVRDDEDLLTTGLVDSLAAMRLVAYIEEDLLLPVPPEDLIIENFATINDMTRYLESRRNR